MGREDDIARQPVAFCRHFCELRRRRQYRKRPVTIGDEPDPLRPGTKATKTADNPEGRGLSTRGFSANAGHGDPDEVRRPLVGGGAFDLAAGLSDTADIFLHLRAARRRRIQNFKDIDDLFQHGPSPLCCYVPASGYLASGKEGYEGDYVCRYSTSTWRIRPDTVVTPSFFMTRPR